MTGPLTSWSSIARHGRLVVLFGGANPKNTQVAKGGCGVHARRRLDGGTRPRRRRGRQHQPDPRRRAGGGGREWIPIRPNTDTAMLLALAHTLVVEGLHDEAFLARYCTGFERVRPYLMGETDGQPKDAAWAAAITGVPAETIRALARRMAATRTMVSASWSLQRADHGEQPYWAVILLAAVLGQIGLPGGGFGFGYGSAAGIAEPPLAVRPARRWRRWPTRSASAIPAARIADCLLHPGEHATTTTARARPIPTSGWSIGPAAIRSTTTRTSTGCAAPGSARRPSSCTSRGGPRRRATPTSCCRRPPRSNATTSAPRTATAYVFAMQQAIEPVGEARSDYAIFSELARRLGCEAAYTEGRDEMAWLRHLYDRWRDKLRTNQAAIPDFDGFWNEGFLEIPRRAEEYVMFGDFRADPRAAQAGARRRAGSSFTPTRSPASAMTIARRIRPGSSRPNGSARRRRALPAASRVEPAALPAAQPDGCGAGERAGQGRGARGDRDQSGRRRMRAASRDGDVVRVHQRPRRLPRRRGGDGRGGARRGAALLRRLVRPGGRRRRHLRARQRQRADLRPRHVAGWARGRASATVLVEIERWTEPPPPVAIFADPPLSVRSLTTYGSRT